MSDIKWYNQEADPGRAQWYFHEEPCEVLRVGARNERVDVMEIKMATGKVVQVFYDHSSCLFPGLTYDDQITLH